MVLCAEVGGSAIRSPSFRMFLPIEVVSCATFAARIFCGLCRLASDDHGSCHMPSLVVSPTRQIESVGLSPPLLPGLSGGGLSLSAVSTKCVACAAFLCVGRARNHSHRFIGA